MGTDGVESVRAVVDAGPIIHLGEIDALELLSVIDDLRIPEQVYRELEDGGVPEGLDSLDHTLVTADRPAPEETELDEGEAAALAAISEPETVFLTDDLDARTVAEERGIEVHGSIGVIALVYRYGLVNLGGAKSAMRHLQSETSLFVTDAVVERGIERLEEMDRS